LRYTFSLFVVVADVQEETDESEATVEEVTPGPNVYSPY